MKYQEEKIRKILESLQKISRVTFAVLCAERWIRKAEGGYKNTSEDFFIDARTYLDFAWTMSEVEFLHREELDRITGCCFKLLEKIVASGVRQGLADLEDGVAILCYALRAIAGDDISNVLWASRMSYEAADRVALALTSIDINIQGSEEKILQHPIVQEEILGQFEKLKYLFEIEHNKDFKILLNRMRERDV